jgi:hypothetical protein
MGKKEIIPPAARNNVEAQNSVSESRCNGLSLGKLDS